jgi:voltage-gated potassium channel
MDSLKKKIRDVIFESETRYGKIFDVFLIVFILLSVFSIILESVSSFQVKYSHVFYVTEVFFTLIFTVEYFLRVYSSEKRLGYALSFFGIIDLLAVIPTWFAFFFTGFKYLLVLRIVRLLRIFRIFKCYSNRNCNK